jgi:hypothetical protein
MAQADADENGGAQRLTSEEKKELAELRLRTRKAAFRFSSCRPKEAARTWQGMDGRVRQRAVTIAWTALAAASCRSRLSRSPRLLATWQFGPPRVPGGAASPGQPRPPARRQLGKPRPERDQLVAAPDEHRIVHHNKCDQECRSGNQSRVVAPESIHLIYQSKNSGRTSAGMGWPRP